MTLAERFWAKVDKSGECWLWTGAVGSHGYGTIGTTRADHPKLAHRVSWEFENGPIPEGMFVCHHCDNRRCVNPKHLFLGTQLDNMRDMIAKGRKPRHPYTEKTHCKHGHEFTPENTGADYRGWGRVCKACREERRKTALKSGYWREYYAKHREALKAKTRARHSLSTGRA